MAVVDFGMYEYQSGWFKDERENNLWFAHINFSSAQATLRRLGKAFQNFFQNHLII